MIKMEEGGREIGGEAVEGGEGLRGENVREGMQFGKVEGREVGWGVCVPWVEPVKHEMWKVLKYRSREI